MARELVTTATKSPPHQHIQVILAHLLGDQHIQVIPYHLIGDQHIQVVVMSGTSQNYLNQLCVSRREESPLGTEPPFFGII